MTMCCPRSSRHTSIIDLSLPYLHYVGKVNTTGIDLSKMLTLLADQQLMQIHGTRPTVRQVTEVSHTGQGVSRISLTAHKLSAELDKNLSAVESSDEFKPPIAKCKAIIAPYVSR